MQTRRQKRLWAVLLVIGLLAGAVGAMLYALQQNIDLFYTPSQLVEGLGKDKVKPVVGQRLRIGGMVVAGSVLFGLAWVFAPREGLLARWGRARGAVMAPEAR